MRTQLDSLIHMTNQIAANLTGQKDETLAAEQVANHILKFWARSMKTQIVDYLNTDGAELSEISKLAIRKVEERSCQKV